MRVIEYSRPHEKKNVSNNNDILFVIIGNF